MKLYALTGGIGSGKSTVAKFIDKEGFPVISADALNAEVAKTSEIQQRIFERFGTNDRMMVLLLYSCALGALGTYSFRRMKAV